MLNQQVGINMMSKKPHADKTLENKQRKAEMKCEKDLARLDAQLKLKDDEIVKLISAQEELISLLKRVQADFENYKKRVENEQAARTAYANSELVRRLLPLLDSFEGQQGAGDSAGLQVGFRLIHAQLQGILRQEGLEPIKAVGERFNPLLHEVLLKEGSDQPRNTVIEEIQKGYLFKERVLRPNKVKISSGPKPAKEEKKEG